MHHKTAGCRAMSSFQTQPRLGVRARGAGRWPLGLTLAAGLAACVGLGGCEIDNYLDPSVVGRWERTPTVVPILERIAAIEGPEESFVEYSDVQPEDLVPELTEYKVGPGDALQITVWNLFVAGQPELIERRVDSRGYVDIPQVGSVFIDGQTLEGVRGSIREAVRPITGETQVDLVVAAEQQRTFNIIGGVGGQGPYFVPYADYRLIDALAAAGGFLESVEHIYVIRQIPLSDEAAGRTRTVAPTTSPSTPAGNGQTPATGENLIDIIDDLLDPGASPSGGSPGAFATPADRAAAPAMPIALIESGASLTMAQPGTSTTPVAPPPSSSGQWLYLNGEWVLVSRQVSAPGAEGPSQLFTQRVIRVPVKPLVAGDARYNIVIRPNDIVRVPPPPQGTVFLAGQVARPGSFGLAPKLTLTRAIYAGGGLGTLAVPERTDLIRMVGPNQQAMIRLNLRAITEGSQPDIFLKENDVVNVGTNFWMYPLAVIRSGFRASYGFGFLLDRNFGSDVFGAPPTNIGGQ